MVLKKPYAFLIKYFRIIHLVLAVPIIYLTYKSANIVNYFNDYIANNYSSTLNGDFSSVFINPFMYLGVILIILATIAVYLLFKYKEKPRKNYIALIIYYLFLFVMLSVCRNILDIMEAEVIEASLARSCRDISLIVLIPQFYFCFFVSLRALGFNIKKLNFANDLKELEISEKDSEEFEFVVGLEGYKTKRKIRRFIREFSYYIKENTFIFVTLIILTIIVIGSSIYVNKETYEINYKLHQVFNYKNFSVSVEDSIVTNLAYNGQYISKDAYYLVIKLNITNNLDKSSIFDYSDFRLEINDELLTPNINRALYFADYAIPYDGKELSAKTTDDYVLVYQIAKEDVAGKYELKIYNGYSTKNSEIKTKYFKVELTPVLIDEARDVRAVGLKEKLDLTNSNIGNTTLTVNDFQIIDKYVYNYEQCYGNECKTYTDFVAVNYLNTGQGSTLLVLDYDLLLDTTSAYSHYIKSEKTFFDNFVSIKYKKGEDTYKIIPVNKTPANIKNTLVLQVSNQIKNADELDLLITVRNKIYNIKLK